MAVNELNLKVEGYIKSLVVGDIIFGKFHIIKICENLVIHSECMECGHIFIIDKKHKGLVEYVESGVRPNSLIPDGFCCAGAQEVVLEKRKAERAEKMRIKKEKEKLQKQETENLAKRGIFKTDRGKYYYSCGGPMQDLPSLAAENGVSIRHIKGKLASGSTVLEAVSFNETIGSDIVARAKDEQLDLKELQKLIVDGMTLDEAVNETENGLINRLAIMFESSNPESDFETECPSDFGLNFESDDSF